MESQVSIGLNGLFGSSFGVEASIGHGGSLALGSNYSLEKAVCSTDDGKEPQDLLASI